MRKAAVWRRSWKRIFGNPASINSFLNCFNKLDGLQQFQCLTERQSPHPASILFVFHYQVFSFEIVPISTNTVMDIQCILKTISSWFSILLTISFVVSIPFLLLLTMFILTPPTCWLLVFQPMCFLNPFSENCVRARHLRALRLSLKGISTFAQAPQLWTVRGKSFPCLRSQSFYGCCHSPGKCQVRCASLTPSLFGCGFSHPATATLRRAVRI